MKARLIPIYFDPGRDDDFDTQLGFLKNLLIDFADFLEPVALGQPLPEAEAVVFPQLLGEAYRQVAAFQAITGAQIRRTRLLRALVHGTQKFPGRLHQANAEERHGSGAAQAL